MEISIMTDIRISIVIAFVIMVMVHNSADYTARLIDARTVAGVKLMTLDYVILLTLWPLLGVIAAITVDNIRLAVPEVYGIATSLGIIAIDCIAILEGLEAHKVKSKMAEQISYVPFSVCYLITLSVLIFIH